MSEVCLVVMQLQMWDVRDKRATSQMYLCTYFRHRDSLWGISGQSHNQVLLSRVPIGGRNTTFFYWPEIQSGQDWISLSCIASTQEICCAVRNNPSHPDTRTDTRVVGLCSPRMQV